MKYLAYFALVTGLAASIALTVMKINAVRKAGRASAREKLAIISLPLFALLMIANLILVTIYF